MALPVKIGFDARFSIGNYRGMGRIVRQMVQGHEKDFYALCASGEHDPELNVVAQGFHFYPLWEQVSLPIRIRKLHLDYFVAPYNTAPLWLPKKTQLILIVHDLIFMESFRHLPPSPSIYQNVGRIYRRLIVPNAIKHACRVLTVSEFSKEAIGSQFQISANRIDVIPCSIQSSWYLENDPVPPEQRDNYMLCVTGVAPSKNLRRALLAYMRVCDIMQEATPCLKVVGVSQYDKQSFNNIDAVTETNGRVEFLQYLDIHEIQCLYRQARAVLVPSLHEGFGLPVLEAMASGTPVISSNRTSLPEVGGDAVAYFDAMNIEVMASCIVSVLQDNSLQKEMSYHGLERAREHRRKTSNINEEFWSQIFR